MAYLHLNLFSPGVPESQLFTPWGDGELPGLTANQTEHRSELRDSVIQESVEIPPSTLASDNTTCSSWPCLP